MILLHLKSGFYLSFFFLSVEDDRITRSSNVLTGNLSTLKHSKERFFTINLHFMTNFLLCYFSIRSRGLNKLDFYFVRDSYLKVCFICKIASAPIPSFLVTD